MLRRSNSAGVKERRPVTLDDLARQAQFAAEGLMDCALTAVRERVSENGKLSAARIEAEQHAAHGLAWLATYVEAIKELAAYAARMREEGRFGQTEELLTRIGLGEYLAQVFGGIPMNQGEIVRLADFGLGPDEIAPFRTEVSRDADRLRQHARKPRRPRRAHRARRAKARSATPASTRPSRPFAARCAASPTPRSSPHAQGWHRANAYIPLEVIAGLSDMGVFGLTIPEEYGGMGLGKVAMCVVSEELSRGYIGVGSLGTRSEIAAELILVGGTEAQKQNTCRRSPAAKSCRPPCSPSPTPAPTSRPCARARRARATTTWSTGPRPGSPIRCAPT